MGCLQLLGIFAILLCSSIASPGFSTNKKDLERAAELAVERAAEKAAERAVEKALNSGNSSTVTVTVKESYKNARKTAEEAAAPGSESTRPYDPKIYNREYSYTPPKDYEDDESLEAPSSNASIDYALLKNYEYDNSTKLTIPDSNSTTSNDQKISERRESYAPYKDYKVDNSAKAVTPRSNITLPNHKKINDRQYSYTPSKNNQGDDSTEAEELGISKESLNSSIEDLKAIEGPSADKSVEVIDPSTIDFESIKDLSEKPLKNFDTSTSLDFGTDFSALDISGDTNFGLKSKTQTFSSSYSKTKDDFPGTELDVDDEEDAEIFKMYAGDFGESGWSSAKQEGWIRHRPLWDDAKPRVSRNFWENFSDDISAVETRTEDKKLLLKKEEKPVEKAKIHKRMVDEQMEEDDRVALPLATVSLDPKTPIALYQLLQQKLSNTEENDEKREKKVSAPLKLYVTIPVPYLSMYGSQNKNDKNTINLNSRNLTLSPNLMNEEMNKDGLSNARYPFKRSQRRKENNYFFLSDRKPKYNKKNTKL